MPKVSVVMAVYDPLDEKVLHDSITSILDQTYQDFEFLICDDGSCESIAKFLDCYAAKDKRIQVFHHKKNRKTGCARNTCIKKAIGDYVMIMDADDWSAPKRMEILVRFLERHPEYDFAGSRGEYFIKSIGDDGEKYWYCKNPMPEDFLFSLPFVHASLMFRRESLVFVNGYDGSKRATRVEDYDLLLRMYAKGMRGYNVSETLYYCRRDKLQYQRRKYRYRFLEAAVKYRGFLALGLMPQGVVYVAKPLVVGLIPIPAMRLLQKRYYAGKQK